MTELTEPTERGESSVLSIPSCGPPHSVAEAETPRQEARDAVRGPRLLVVRGSEYMSGESVAFLASVAAENIDAE